MATFCESWVPFAHMLSLRAVRGGVWDRAAVREELLLDGRGAQPVSKHLLRPAHARRPSGPCSLVALLNGPERTRLYWMFALRGLAAALLASSAPRLGSSFGRSFSRSVWPLVGSQGTFCCSRQWTRVLAGASRERVELCRLSRRRSPRQRSSPRWLRPTLTPPAEQVSHMVPLTPAELGRASTTRP